MDKVEKNILHIREKCIACKNRCWFLHSRCRIGLEPVLVPKGKPEEGHWVACNYYKGRKK